MIGSMNHENLWAPWRSVYLRELSRKAEGSGWDEVSAGNFLAEYWGQPEHDGVNHVVYRDGDGMLLLNRYPYSNGHLLAALGDPRPTLMDYGPQARLAFWRLIEVGLELIDAALHPQGINVGINQGRAAGAGVPEHLHAHLVPRWQADTNFITIVGQVRVIPDSLEGVAKQYRETLGAMG